MKGSSIAIAVSAVIGGAVLWEAFVLALWYFNNECYNPQACLLPGEDLCHPHIKDSYGSISIGGPIVDEPCQPREIISCTKDHLRNGEYIYWLPSGWSSVIEKNATPPNREPVWGRRRISVYAGGMLDHQDGAIFIDDQKVRYLYLSPNGTLLIRREDGVEHQSWL